MIYQPIPELLSISQVLFDQHFLHFCRLFCMPRWNPPVSTAFHRLFVRVVDNSLSPPRTRAPSVVTCETLPRDPTSLSIMDPDATLQRQGSTHSPSILFRHSSIALSTPLLACVLLRPFLLLHMVHWLAPFPSPPSVFYPSATHRSRGNLNFHRDERPQFAMHSRLRTPRPIGFPYSSFTRFWRPIRKGPRILYFDLLYLIRMRAALLLSSACDRSHVVILTPTHLHR